MSTAGTELNEIAESAASETKFKSPLLSLKKKKLVWAGVIAGILGLFMFFGLMGAWASRAFAPTKKGWTCLPVSRGGLICQNIRSWYRGRSYARNECANALVEAAGYVRARMPEVSVAYMDASDSDGGRFMNHKSHRDGVDVDVLYIGRTWGGSPYPAQPAIFTTGYDLNYDRSRRHGSLTFDTEANWLFLEGLHAQKARDVEAIFVEPYIREWLLQAGKETNAPKEVRQWAASVLSYAGAGAGDHKDHFHVRFAK